MSDRLAEIEARLLPRGDCGAPGCPECAPLRDLLEVAKAAREVLDAYDNAEAESNWTGAMVDTVLRTTLANLEETP